MSNVEPYIAVSSLRELNLCHNALTGSIPSQIGLLTSLWQLSLNNNALTGSIPFQIGLLTSLHVGLGLAYNALTGSIPSQIGLLTNLRGLGLSHNALTAGTIPSSFCIGGGKAYIDCEKITTCSCCYEWHWDNICAVK
jgi:Leucine-rich repeat (LRR) protein